MDFVSYQPLYWLALLVPLAIAYRFSLLERHRLLTVATMLRCTAVILIVLALCRPFIAHDVSDAHVIFMIDTSESVDREQCKGQ